MTINIIPSRSLLLLCLLCSNLTLAFVASSNNKSPVRKKETHLFPTFIRGTMETAGDFTWPQSYRHDDRHADFEWAPHGGCPSRDPFSQLHPNVKDVHSMDHHGRESVFNGGFIDMSYDDEYYYQDHHESYREPLHRNVKDVHRPPDRTIFEYGRSGSDVWPHFMNENDVNNKGYGKSDDGLWPQNYVNEPDSYSSSENPVACDTERWERSTFRNDDNARATKRRKRSPWTPIGRTSKAQWPHEAGADITVQNVGTTKVSNPRTSSASSSFSNDRVWPHEDVTTTKTVNNEQTAQNTFYTAAVEPPKDKFASSWLERERLPEEIEKAKKMTVKQLKSALKDMGIPTKSTWRKKKYVQTYAEAVVSGGWWTIQEDEKCDDESVREVVAEKYNPEESRFSGQRPVIDV